MRARSLEDSHSTSAMAYAIRIVPLSSSSTLAMSRLPSYVPSYENRPQESLEDSNAKSESPKDKKE